VLLIEDNSADAVLIQDLLASPGTGSERITHVMSIAAGLDRLASHGADAILLDLRLGDCTGLECVKAIRASVPEVAIVVLTGMEDEETALACLGAGAQDYLLKHEMRARSLQRAIDYAVTRAREMAERRRADELQQRLAAIVEASGDAIVSAEPGGVVTSWNRGAEAIFGYAREEAVGSTARAVVRASVDPRHRPAADDIDRVLTGGDAVTAAEVVCIRKDGRLVTVSGTGFPLLDATGRPFARAAIFRDVTEIKRRDDELRARTAEIAAHDQQMRVLAARLTAIREAERIRISREVHDELGQLLTGLKMDLRWIKRRLPAINAAVDLEVASRLAEAERLLDGTVATVQRIAIELRPSVLDSLGLAPAIRDEARRFEARSDISVALVLDAEPEYHPDVATTLFRVLQELLTNVARHAQASSVAIALREDGESWAMEVTDDGVGISDHAIDDPGSLGLLSIRERVDMSGGSVVFRRAASGGTTVSVRIPR